MTPDVVESGPERPRRGVAVGAAALLLLGVAAYGATRDAREPDPAPSPTASAAARFRDDERARTAARPAPWPNLPPLRARTGLLVAAAGPELAVVDVDSGDVTRVPMPSVAHTQPVAAIPGGWLVFVRELCRAAHCTDPLYAVRGGRATLVARAERAFPDPDGRSLWLTGYTYRAAEPDANPPWLERRALDGRRLVRRVRLRPRERVVGVTARGPVTAFVGRRGQEILLRGADGRARSVLARWASPLAVSRDAVATTTEECVSAGSPAPCGLTLIRLDGTTTELGHVWSPVHEAAFDPTGRRLAVVLAHDLAAEPPRAGTPAVEVYDVVAGRLRDAGIPFPSAVAALGWGPDGRHLVLAHATIDAPSGGTRFRLTVWRPGEEDARAGPAFDGDGGPLLAVGSRS